jgi:N6-adenosine-specific RNA methylase IME4
VIQAPRREHSRKPDELYAIIERAYPELPKIELFARHARPGWTAWGDEAPGNTARVGPIGIADSQLAFIGRDGELL